MHLLSGAANGGGLSVEDIKSGHYVGTWGPLSSKDGELFSLPDVIRVVGVARRLPLLNAANSVLIGIRDDLQARCYITRPGEFAYSIKRPDVWPPAPPLATPKGRKKAARPVLGALDLADIVRGYFDCLLKIRDDRRRFVAADLYVIFWGGQLAIHREDALRLFGVEFDSVFAQKEPAAEPAPASHKPASANSATGWPEWPKPKDKPGCRLLFEAWERAGGTNGGTKAAATHYGMSGRAVELRTRQFREAGGLTREKPNPGAVAQSSGAALAAVSWTKTSATATRR